MLSRLLCTTLIAAAALGLTACGGKDKKSGQALASVNGEEVTAMQLNEEVQRSGASQAQAQQPAFGKQLLEGLIDRQLVVNAAVQEKIDRDPQVVRAIERAKALLIAQAYMQKKVGTVAKPTPTEVSEYFTKHPELFSNRKQFDMRQLVLASADLSPALKAAIDGAKSLDEVAAYMDSHNIKFGRNQVAHTSADLPPELSSKLLAMQKGQLFIIKEGERSVIVMLSDIKDAPVTQEMANAQIEQYLFNTKNKEAAAAELARLRAAAKIEYMNKAAEEGKAADAAAPVAKPAAAKPEASSDANARGVAGLK